MIGRLAAAPGPGSRRRGPPVAIPLPGGGLARRVLCRFVFFM